MINGETMKWQEVTATKKHYKALPQSMYMTSTNITSILQTLESYLCPLENQGIWSLAISSAKDGLVSCSLTRYPKGMM